MSAENTGTDLSTGQAVPSLNQRGNDEFSSLLSGDGSGSGGQAEVTQKTEVKVPGTQEKPELETVTPQKKADGGQQQTQQTQQQSSTAGQQQTQQSPGSIDPNVLNQIVEASVRSAVGAQQQQNVTAAQVKEDQKELTDAEFAAKYNLANIDESVIQGILDADPKKGAAMLNRILRQNIASSVLMAQDIVKAQLKSVRDEMAPHVTSWKEFQRVETERKNDEAFYAKNPDLVNEKPLVKEMQDAIFGRIASGQLKPFTRLEDALQAVADGVRLHVSRMNKQAGVGAAGGSQQSQQKQSNNAQGQGSHQRQMTAASTAGQSGAGQSAGQSDEERIFGKDYV